MFMWLRKNNYAEDFRPIWIKKTIKPGFHLRQKHKHNDIRKRS